MRVIAGEFRSRPLKSVPGDATRPTSDRMRESVFNILTPSIQGATFIDAYAGTGAVGIEALSRGASHVWFLERERVALDVIRQNLTALKVGSQGTVVPGPVVKNLVRFAAEIVFLDPPYDDKAEYAAVLELLGQAATPLVIVQHSIRLALQEAYGNLHRGRRVKQGDNELSFYAPPAGLA